MYSGQHRDSRGFTLIEVLVVLGIIALVSAIAIPGLAKLGAFSRDEFKRTVSQVDSILRAAQIYSTTYRVNTAVVYNMDNFNPTEVDGAAAVPITDPIIDSFTGLAVRQIEAAAVMYQLPSGMGRASGLYVPIPGDLGEFQAFPPGMAVLLQDPESPTAASLPGEYAPVYTLFSHSNYYVDDLNPNQIGQMGMNSVSVALGIPLGLTNVEFNAFVSDSSNYDIAQFPVHLFKPSGRIGVTASNNEGRNGRERYSLYIAPSVDRPLEERLVDPNVDDLVDADGRSNLRYRKIYLHKSTARTSVPDAF